LDGTRKPRTFTKFVQAASTLVLNLLDFSDLEEAEYVIKMVRQNQDPTTLVLLTPISTWALTPPKLKPA